MHVMIGPCPAFSCCSRPLPIVRPTSCAPRPASAPRWWWDPRRHRRSRARWPTGQSWCRWAISTPRSPRSSSSTAAPRSTPSSRSTIPASSSRRLRRRSSAWRTTIRRPWRRRATRPPCAAPSPGPTSRSPGISITIIRPVAGSIANWMLQPPVSTPTARMMPMATSRIRWYSRSVRVIAGATVIESPVCTPIGSKFSIEQTMTTLSARSRMTSSSYSFQPRIDSSISTSVVGLAESPAPAIRRSSISSCAKPEPTPPIVKLGRTTSG